MSSISGPNLFQPLVLSAKSDGAGAVSRGRLAASETPFEHSGLASQSATIITRDKSSVPTATGQLLRVSEVVQPNSDEILRVEFEETDLDYGSEAAS